LRIIVTLAAFALWLLSPFIASAQHNNNITADNKHPDSVAITPVTPDNYLTQTDIIDVVRKTVHKGVGNRTDTGVIKSTRPRVSVVPAAGYTLQTEFAGLVAGNAAFYTHKDANTSTIVTSFSYTERDQVILPLQTSIWTRGNKYNIVTDWRYLYYPSYTYGLGGYTSTANGYIINFSTLHFHQAVLRELAEDMYAGVGYNLDYFWNIYEINPPGNIITDFETYGFGRTEFASGFTLNFLYDTRQNSINPQKGNFVNVIYRPNLTIFGNTANWRSLIVDLRKYIRFPARSNNILAFWSYEWLTVDGKPPYLMLPNTGGDPYSNTGRGYIQGRFRGANMAYLEAEYRFGLTRNGLLGGVVFGNAQSFTEQASNNFETVAPGWGAGLRLKFNKFSNTNVALDYGFGLHGSGGLFVNIGEVF
jgi:outer membrane protein assembly factor BamA